MYLSYALALNTTGDYNTAVGLHAGGYNTSGNNNVFIGLRAGYNSTYQIQVDKLVIANGSQSNNNELIIGDFAAQAVGLVTQSI